MVGIISFFKKAFCQYIFMIILYRFGELDRYSKEWTKAVIVGTKSDRVSRREVSYEEALVSRIFSCIMNELTINNYH
jgi:hypothetical protein